MPNKPIDFKFTADVVNLLNGLGKAELSVEDLEQAFVEASNSSKDLERKINRATREAERDVEKLERAIDQLPKATDKAADKAAKDFDRIGDEGREAGREVGDEFRQNLGESLSSGNVEDLFSDTLGGIVGSMSGPVGLAAAAVAGLAAVGFNAIRDQYEKVQAFAQSQADSIQQLYTQGIKTGTAVQELDAFNAWLESQRSTIQGLRGDFQAVGISQGEFLAAAWQGGQPLEDIRLKLERIVDEGTNVEGTGRNMRTIYSEGAMEAQALLQFVREQAGANSENAQWYKAQAASSQELAAALGLADTNGDGIINDTDVIAGNLDQAQDSAEQLSSNLNLPFPLQPYMTTSEFLKGARSDAEQTLYVLQQIESLKLTDKNLAVNVYGVDRGNRPISPFIPKYE
jgi:hypothetical protein